MKILTAILAMATASTAFAREYHVSVKGNDTNTGSAFRPFKTIATAANVAQPGDVITVHAGTYRERVTPPRGGTSDKKRITYQAARGEKVVITGSEPVKGWEKVEGDTWKVIIPNKFFGSFNPYNNLIHGDWFDPKGRQHHTGAVYLNGDWLMEATKLDEALKPTGKTPLWFSKVDAENTTIWAQFPGVNPNESNVEINVRKTVFTPEKTGINYITVRGFTLRNAATNWAPPTAGQIGLVSAYWCKGWIIENNDIAYSKCSGVALGKYGDEHDNTSADTPEGYVLTVQRALKNGWNKETVGSHIVRNNRIHHCEQTGVVGSLGCSFSTVTGNEIHDIHVHQLFGGAEMAAIKFHGAVDVVISGNHIFRACRGIWLDWMAQGAHISRNLLHDNGPQEDLFLEVDHGPVLIANNVLLSPLAVNVQSQGDAFVHNLIDGNFFLWMFDGRQTPFHKPHSTEIAKMHENPSGDDRFYNNIFTTRAYLTSYDGAVLPVQMDGNVFLNGAKPSKHEKTPLLKTDFNPGIKLVERPDGWYLEFAFCKAWRTEQPRMLVTTELLGKAKIPDVPFENADGSPIRIATDYLGENRNAKNPFPGPFELPGSGRHVIKVWPRPPKS